MGFFRLLGVVCFLFLIGVGVFFFFDFGGFASDGVFFLCCDGGPCDGIYLGDDGLCHVEQCELVEGWSGEEGWNCTFPVS